MFKAPKVNTISIQMLWDTDGDGVPDYKDCRPFDRTKQHLRPSKTTMQRLESLEFEIKDREGANILSKEAHPYDKRLFLRMIKRHPSVVGHLERSTHMLDFEFNRYPVHTKGGDNEYGLTSTQFSFKPYVQVNCPIPRKETNAELEELVQLQTDEEMKSVIGMYPKRFETPGSKDEYRKKIEEHVRHNLYLHPYYKLSKKRGSRKLARSQAEIAHHELTHVNQFQRNMYDMMQRENLGSPYLERKHEQEAYESAEKYMQKYKKEKVTQDLIDSTFRIADNPKRR
jgi:hypothetical protein